MKYWVKRIFVCVVCILCMAVIFSCPDTAVGGSDDSSNSGNEDSTAPDEVTGLSVIIGNGSLRFDWIDPDTADFDHVKISFTPLVEAISQPISIDKDLMTCTIEGLQNGTEYTFTVKTADSSGNTSAGTGITGTPDGDSPTASLTSGSGGFTNNAVITVSIEFNEAVSGFTGDDIQVINGAITDFSALDSRNYSITLEAAAPGEVSITVPAGSAEDISGNTNLETAPLTIVYDTSAPQGNFTTLWGTHTNNGSESISLTFTDLVEGFDSSDLIITGGSISNFQSDDTILFTFDISPSAEGTVTILLPANVCTDRAGNQNEQQQFDFIYDTTGPTVLITSTIQDVTNTSPVVISLEMDEEVTPFTLDALTLTNCTGANLETSDGITYTVNIIPTGQNVSIEIGDGKIADPAGNLNTASNRFEFTFDSDQPTASLTSGVSGVTNGPFILALQFTEAVTGLSAGSFDTTNCTVDTIEQNSPAQFSITVIPAGEGEVFISLPEGSVFDSGNNPNLGSNEFSIEYDRTPPGKPVITAVEKTENTRPTMEWNIPLETAKFSYRFGGGEWIETADTTVVSFTPEQEQMLGTYTFEVRAGDTAGNWSEAASFDITIYLQEPLISNIEYQGGKRVKFRLAKQTSLSDGYIIERKTGAAGTYDEIEDYNSVFSSFDYTDTDPELAREKTYYYRVKAYNSSGSSAYSNELSVLILPLPAAPSNVRAELQEDGSVIVTWDDNSNNESAFLISKRRTIWSSYGSEQTAGANSVTYTDNNYDYNNPDDEHQYRVRAYFGGFSEETRDYSELAYAEPIYTATRPDSPTVSNPVQLSDTEIEITFLDRADDETGYMIERKFNGGEYEPIASLDAVPGDGTEASFIDTIPPAGGGKRFTYQVRAVKQAPDSSFYVKSDRHSSGHYIDVPLFLEEFNHTYTLEFDESDFDRAVVKIPAAYADRFKVFCFGNAQDAQYTGDVIVYTSLYPSFWGYYEQENTFYYTMTDTSWPVKEYLYLHIEKVTAGTFGVTVEKCPRIELTLFDTGEELHSGRRIDVDDTRINIADETAFQISNVGKADLIVSELFIENDPENNFQVLNSAEITAAPIAPGDSKVIRVQFLPTTTGTKDAGLVIRSNEDADEYYRISLRGEAHASIPQIEVRLGTTLIEPYGVNDVWDTYIQLGEIEPGFSEERTITIYNLGDAPLVFENPPVSTTQPVSVDTTLTAASVEPGGSTTFRVILTPEHPGYERETVDIMTNDPIVPAFQFDVRGRGMGPEIDVKNGDTSYESGNAVYTFPDDVVNSPSQAREIVFTIENSGNRILGISSINLTDTVNFTLEESVSPSIAPGGTATVKVLYNPTTGGDHETNLVITSDDSNESTYSITLKGTGVENTRISELGTWYPGEFTGPDYTYSYYVVAVTAGTTYTIVWDDFADGSGFTTGDIEVSCLDMDFSNRWFLNADDGYTAGRNVTPDYTGHIILKVRTRVSASPKHGTYFIGAVVQ